MSAKIPKKRVKVEIKNEKDELKSMSHYVDDRVELVKQIFSCLKLKTIKHLAPDFIKESSREEIEELCLNELLGLSTKRLLSIINATKCPTDTESSSDSDVHNVEEHISLEEISSESESEKNNANKQKRTKKDRTAKTRQDGTNEKSVSVLELLELQARARAIRSQLALEPVAKIEVDSDDSIDGGIQSNDTSIASSRKTKENSNASKTQQTSKLANGAKSSAQRIKLKRNFRKQNRSDDDESQNTDKEEAKVPGKESEETKNSTENNVNGEKKSRSPSPDVITILPSPETLCISDSSDEDEKMNDNDKCSTKNSALNSETKTQEKVLDDKKDVETSSTSKDKENEKADELNTFKPSEDNIDFSKSIEVEDGEIVDNKEENEGEIKSGNNDEIEAHISEEDQTRNQNENPKISENETTEGQSDTEKISKSNIITDSVGKNSTDPSSEKLKSNFSEKRIDSYDDSNQQNDDVISLIHDDLEDDFQENESSDAINSKEIKLEKIKSKDTENSVIDQPDNDIITLHNSSDEDSTLDQFADTKESQSWNSRWLQSNRVSKILATSRLGNRVRDKIKKSKKQNEEVEEVIKSDEVPEVFESQFEEGSVQQYAEILERTS